ncbi:hypothetical protein [Bacillus inaquosorum]|uniref:hypothetical protein n=1 Tax=Bacillus inaquosorum TaxID=483913 RepID=UPI002280640C|nr:hypothetical protein [Bacillus inaquosorum]MCY8056451.1 hypothetical protein [Bacillus inaquosorum]
MKSFNDISPLEGVYSDFVFLKDNALVTIVKVPGINVDLLSLNQQNILFDSYGAFVSQYVHYKLQTLSMTVPVKMDGYIKKWKERYIQSKNDPNMTNDLKQLIASYLYEYQKSETDLDTAVKAHFMVLKEDLKQPTLENLRMAEKRLIEKRDEVIRSLHSVLEEYDSNPEVLTATEGLSLLHQFLDYRSSMFTQ